MESLDTDLFDNLQALVVVINNRGEVLFVNNAVQHFLGYDSRELMGESWWINTKYSLKEAEEVKQRVLSLFVNAPVNSAASFEHRLKTQNGISKWVRWNAKPMKDGTITALGLDITDKKRYEEQLVVKHNQLKIRNRELSESLEYAARLQRAMLSKPVINNNVISDLFVYYKPKEAVGGDFYTFYECKNRIVVFLGDCTGHGVPGAMMTMLASNIVQRIIQTNETPSACSLLSEIDKQLTDSLNQNDEEVLDGMDAVLCVFDKETRVLQFASAQQSVWLNQQGLIRELKGSLFPIGLWQFNKKRFVDTSVQLNSGDQVVLSTDGFYDQFGGEQNKKFKRRNFSELLQLIQEYDCNEKEAFLEYTFNNWKQNCEQTDDVAVLGFSIA